MSKPTPDRRERRRGSPWRTLTALAGAAAMLAAMAVLIAPAANAAPNPKVELCHWTNGGHYNDLSISANAVFQQGHDQHLDNRDIIPPFDYTDNDGVAQHYVGLNWPEGEETLKNGCKIPNASLGLTKSASPAQFSASGTAITYTFTVTNTGSATISNITIVDGPFTGTGVFGAITCLASVLAPAASTTCTASYSTTSGDIANGKLGKDLRNSAYATGTSFGGDVTSPRDTATVTYVPPAPVDIPVTLNKSWVDPVNAGDAVSLTIAGSGVYGVSAGESHADGVGDTTATAKATQGSDITLAESFTAGNETDYVAALQCSVDRGLPISVPVDAPSFTIPADASSVACSFRNTSKSTLAGALTVNLIKDWATSADAGDQVRLQVQDTTTGTTNNAGTSTNGSASGTSSLAVFPGDTVTISESAMGTTDLTHYDATYACTIAGGGPIDLSGGSSFTVPADLQAGTIDCTITNTHKTRIAVTKKWIIDGTTYTVPWDGKSPVLPADYGAKLEIDSVDVPWGDSVDTSPAPRIVEKDVTLADSANCTSAQSPIDLSNFAVNTDNTVVVTNTVTCTTPPGGGENPGGGTPPVTTTPTPTSPQVLGVSSSVKPSPRPSKSVEVKGVSRQETAPPVQVLGASQSLAAAPSANAHTGQGSSPWVYVLLAAGVALMLGAAGIRRRGRA